MFTNSLAEPAPGRPDIERIYAIGDVHGHCDRLQDLHRVIRDDLRAVPATAQLVHLGDYIDRGPDAAGCLEVLSRGSPIAGVPVCNLLGNHEQMLIDALDQQPGAVQHWLQNGGDATLRSWGIDPYSPAAEWRARIPPHHLRVIAELKLFHVAAPYCFVHAGVRPGIRLAMQSAADLLWIRDEFLAWTGTMLPDAPRMRIVHGHTPSAEPELRPNRLGIDTNAARGGKLTCAALCQDSVYFLQV